MTLNPPNATNETLCYSVGFPKLGHIIMALMVNSLLCNLPNGRKLLIMQISISSHFIFICYPVLMVKL